MDKSSTGLDSHVAAALAYALGWISGLALLLVERESRFVRFHALQSAVAFGALSLGWLVALSIPFFGLIAAFFVIPAVSLVLWLLLMFKAWQGERYKVPIVGEMIEERMKEEG